MTSKDSWVRGGLLQGAFDSAISSCVASATSGADPCLGSSLRNLENSSMDIGIGKKNSSLKCRCFCGIKFAFDVYLCILFWEIDVISVAGIILEVSRPQYLLIPNGLWNCTEKSNCCMVAVWGDELQDHCRNSNGRV